MKIGQTIYFCILLNFIRCSKLTCDSDEYCMNEINQIYQCNTSSNLCQRIPIVQNLNYKIGLGLFFILILNLIGYIISISANSINMTLFVFIFGFTFHDTQAILKIANLLPSMFNWIMIANLRNPKKANSLYTNFNMILFMYPLILTGSICGTLLFLISPSFISYFLVFVMLFGISIKNFKKYQEIRDKYNQSLVSENLKMELQQRADKEMPIEVITDTNCHNPQQNKSDQPPYQSHPDKIHEDKLPAVIDNEDHSVKTQLSSEIISIKQEHFCSLIYKVRFQILLIIFSFMIIILAYLIKGSVSHTSILNNMQCSPSTICMFLLFCIPLIFISYYGNTKFRKSLHSQNERSNQNATKYISIKLAIVSLVGGFISTVGVGSSLFVSSTLMLFDFEPLVVKCTMTWITMLMAANNTFQFIFIGYFDWKNILIFTGLGLFGCMLSNLFIKELVAQNMNAKANQIIALSCCLMGALVCLAIPVTSYFEYKNNQSFMHMGSIC